MTVCEAIKTCLITRSARVLRSQRWSPSVLTVAKRKIPQSYSCRTEDSPKQCTLSKQVSFKSTRRKVNCSSLIFLIIENSLLSYNTSRLHFLLPPLHPPSPPNPSPLLPTHSPSVSLQKRAGPQVTTTKYDKTKCNKKRQKFSY